MAQVVKQYAGKRVVAIERRLVQGTMDQVQALLQRTQGGGTINTAYIERLNATFRSRIAALVRRRPSFGPPNGDLARLDVSGWHGLQLLHVSS